MSYRKAVGITYIIVMMSCPQVTELLRIAWMTSVFDGCVVSNLRKEKAPAVSALLDEEALLSWCGLEDI